MGKKGGAGENGKKAQGQARKAEAAASKAAAESAKKEAAEEAEWDRGAKKGSAKKEQAEAKKAEAARKKAERDALLAEEDSNTPGRSAPKNAKTAAKKTKGIDEAFGDLDTPLSELNATGIENAIDALGLTAKKPGIKIDRRPEKRTRSGRAAFEERIENELKAQGVYDEMKAERNAIRKYMETEWRRAPENPKNHLSARINATREELEAIEAEEKAAIEQRLGTK